MNNIINEINEKIIELENAVQKESELSGFVRSGITVLNILTKIKTQLRELEKVIRREMDKDE